MRYFRFLPVAVLVCQLAWGGDDAAKRAGNGDSTRLAAPAASVVLPPVLRVAEPTDDVVLTLPGPPPKPVVVTPPPPPATIVRPAPPPVDPERPILRRSARVFPDGFEKDGAEFLHQRLGQWDEAAARELLGEPRSSRPAYDDDKTVNGQIFAFSDPTGRYRELELDFDRESGRLRTVFVYPFTMTWQQCRREFGGAVRATKANKGRIFYSYVDRRLDVLVDPGGNVISLGMY